MKGAATIFGDERIYCQKFDGKMMLLEFKENKLYKHGEIDLGKMKDFWAHPVINNGKLYLRHGAKLYCYSIKK